MAPTVGTVTATSSKDKDWKSFEVSFDGFANLPAKKGVDIFSPEFTCFGHQWCLHVYPGGSETSVDGRVSIFLHNRSNASRT